MNKSIEIKLEYINREEIIEETVHDPRTYIDELLTNQPRKNGLKKIYVNGVLWWEGANFKLNKNAISD